MVLVAAVWRSLPLFHITVVVDPNTFTPLEVIPVNFAFVPVTLPVNVDVPRTDNVPLACKSVKVVAAAQAKQAVATIITRAVTICLNIYVTSSTTCADVDTTRVSPTDNPPTDTSKHAVP